MTEQQSSVERALAAELGTLVDARGLVMNPSTDKPRPVDVYSTAWLATLADNVKRALPGEPDVTALMSEPDELAFNRKALPKEQFAWSVVTLAARSGESLDPDAVLLDAATFKDPVDDDDRAAKLWIAAVLESAVGRSGYPGSLRDVLESTAGGGRLSVISGRFVLHGCRLVAATCPDPALEPVKMKLEGPLDVFTLAAAATLEHEGTDVPGYSGAEANTMASAALAGLPQGNDVVAGELSTIIALEGGDAGPGLAYLDGASDRWDGHLGMYRQYVDYQGTVAGTYAARGMLGPEFTDFAERHGTYKTLASLLASGELDMVSQLQAMAIMSEHDPDLAASYRPTIDAARARYAGRTVSGTELATALAVVGVLIDLGAPPQGLEIAPVELTDVSERVVDKLIALAHDGRIVNRADVLSAYADYIAGLPSATIADGPSHPNFHARLALLDYLDHDWTARESQALGEAIRARTGCPALAHLATRSLAPSDGCDIFLTEAVVNSTFGIEALGKIS